MIPRGRATRTLVTKIRSDEAGEVNLLSENESAAKPRSQRKARHAQMNDATFLRELITILISINLFDY